MDTNKHLQQKIFLVDDNEMTCLLYEQFIRNLGYTDVTSFQDGLKCLNSLTEEPHIVFLDQNLGEMKGIEIIRKIKRFDPNIYVVFVSDQQEIETAVQSLKLGAFDYIVKGDGDTQSIEVVLNKIKHVQEMLSSNSKNPLKKFLSLLL